MVLEKARNAVVKVRTQVDNVAGVSIPKFESYQETGEGLCGFWRGSASVFPEI
jgi:hypothetical protein